MLDLRRPRAILSGALALVMLVALTACGVEGRWEKPSTSGRSGTVVGTVATDGLDLRHPGGLELHVPAGALPAGTTVRVKPVDAPRERLRGLSPQRRTWDVHSDAQPTSPVTLVIPFDPELVPSGAKPLLATYDEQTRWWLPSPTRVHGNTMTAKLTSFSLKTWILDRVRDGQELVSWAEYQAGRLLGNRAGPPNCGGKPAVPQWVRHWAPVGRNTPILWCPYGADGDHLALDLANNRGYPLSVHFNERPATSSSSLLDAQLNGVLHRMLARSDPDGVLMLATGDATVRFARPTSSAGTLRGYVRRDGVAIVQWLVLQALEFVGGSYLNSAGQLALDVANCAVATASSAGKAFEAGSTLDGSKLVDAVVGTKDCVASTLAAEVRRVGTTGGDVAKNLKAALRWVKVLQAVGYAQLMADLLRDQGDDDVAYVRVQWRYDPDVYLYTLTPTTDAALGPAGQHVDAEMGGRHYGESTSTWVGCEETASTLTYQLDGRYRRLTATAGLLPHAPPELVARMTVVGDGRVLADVSVGQGTSPSTAPVDVDLTGVTTLVLSAQRTAGECSSASLGYGGWGDALLR